MLFRAMPTTLAFAPAPEDLEEVHFDTPVLTFASVPVPVDDEESEPREPCLMVS